MPRDDDFREIGPDRGGRSFSGCVVYRAAGFAAAVARSVNMPLKSAASAAADNVQACGSSRPSESWDHQRHPLPCG